MINGNQSPFSFFNTNIKGNNLCFNNNSSKKLNESTSDFFAIEDNKQSNLQFRTKQRMGFYNNGNSSQVKQYLDYFLKRPNINNINDANFTSCAGTGKQVKLIFASNQEINFKNSFADGYNNNSINVNDSNNAKLNNENDEEKDCCCPPPCCKPINNNSNNNKGNSSNNNNYRHELEEPNFNLLSNEISNMSLNEKKERKVNNSNINENSQMPFNENKIKKINSYINENSEIPLDEKKLKKINPNIIEKIAWLDIEY